jgi:hypothetical protein
MIALEAKDSSSAVNSVKRLNNDTAAKTKHFAAEAGRSSSTLCCYPACSSRAALPLHESPGLYLVWAHDLNGFIEWIKSQT